MKQLFYSLIMLLGTASCFANTLVLISTSEGDIILELYDDKVPVTVKNFLQYVEDDFYSGTIFHRVISIFMIQGGGFDQDLLRKKTREPIINEASRDLKNMRGTIAMARLNDPHSATAQFYINTQDNPALNHTGKQNSQTWGYAVFGHVVKGLDVVDEIRFKPTGAKMHFKKDVPLMNVTINSVKIIDTIPETEANPEANE
ncbi:MAG: peptidylprolyl isomerase [Proteobacteria bacterium]|nr:peptidylprolyl isomerase [Pseudomonadota bacterium]